MFNAQDLQDLQTRGIPPAEAERQLALFKTPPAPAQLERPCTAGDGILRLDDKELSRLKAVGHATASQGRLSKFVPASGAATRMFQDLLTALEWKRISLKYLQEKDSKHAVRVFLENRERLPFFEALREALAANGDSIEGLLSTDDWRPYVRALLKRPGLGYADLPKALLAFHRYPSGSRTALEEQLLEGARLVRRSDGLCRLHLTVSPEHQSAFEALLKAKQPALETALGCRFEIKFSTQKPSTDTLAAEDDGSPFRDAEGHLVFRPGGHGALLDNLEATGGDLVLVKNIDNVPHESQAALGWDWKWALAGLASELQSQAQRLAEDLAAGKGSVAEAKAFLRERFFITDSPDDQATLASWLDRPLRVAGMVQNTGEPGGGPFWVRGSSGRLSPQIVESAQVNLSDSAQLAAFNASTHFNPVDLVCALRNSQGRAHELRKFRDDSAIFVSKKSKDGRPLRALELPGLWNGSMANWLTLFVEVPGETFNPVKTVTDLLRPAHQPTS